jgi:delta24-sterol reductase
VRNADKSSSRKIALRSFRAILGLSEDRTVIHIEPGVTVGELTKWLLRQEPPLQLECTLEMVDATLGGLAMATGMTTHSHVCGLIHETVVEYELVTAAGEVLTVGSQGAHAELFRALPWSHGTLGFLASLKLRVVPAKKWVRLRYTALHGRDNISESYLSALKQQNPAFFIEAIVYARDAAMLMDGELVDKADLAVAHVPVNRIGLWFKPWFHKHVESKLHHEGCSEELIPIWDYLMRHDRAMCMTMATIIPYGNALWFRWLLGWALPPSVSFLKSSHTQQTREASIRKQVYQDVAFPAECLNDALDTSHRLFQVYPLMCYPCLVRDRPGMLRLPGMDPVSRDGKAHMYLNLGIYGIPKEQRDFPYDLFPMVTRVRELEAWIREHKGFQHTYCDSFQSEAEFEEMFDHRLYDHMRKQYGAERAFQRVWQKTRPEMDVNVWLQEEQESQVALKYR